MCFNAFAKSVSLIEAVNLSEALLVYEASILGVDFICSDGRW